MEYKRHQKGFTVSELLVVVAVVSLLLVTILLGRDDTRDDVELTNTAHEAALLIRSAQTMGSNGRMHVTAAFPDGRPVPHGVYLTPGARVISLFVDENISLSFDSGEEILEEYRTPSDQVTIERFCVTDRAGNPPSCFDQSNRSLHIVYARPDVSPFMSVYKSGANPLVGDNYKKAVVYLASSGGNTQPITIESEGLIYVEN